MSNTLPLHRFALPTGAVAQAPAAHVRAHGSSVERLEQQYARTPDDGGHQRYDYTTPAFDFSYQLVYDEAGPGAGVSRHRRTRPLTPRGPIRAPGDGARGRADQPASVAMPRLRGGASYAGVVFFIFGFGTKQQHLGPGETRTCPHCHNTTRWERIRESQQFTVFFVPVARWKRRQLEVCGICGTAVEA